MGGHLPEEFAPTGPKLSKFPIRPAPPIRPHLFADEARFALRLAIAAGATEFAAWTGLLLSTPRPHAWAAAVVALLVLRLLKPFWARLGTRLPRPAIAFVLLAAALAAAVTRQPGLLWLAGLPALADLCATCIADSVTVERRSAAFAWLDMGQALGGVCALALASSFPAMAAPISIAMLALAFVGVRELHDRGTPRSSWPLAAYASVLRSPLCAQLAALAFVTAALGSHPLRTGPPWLALMAPFAGMAVAARIEPRMPNAVLLPRLAVLLALAGLSWAPLGLFAVGAIFAAIPAAVARGAGEMERPLVSSLAWSSLIAGAAVGAVL